MTLKIELKSLSTLSEPLADHSKSPAVRTVLTIHHGTPNDYGSHSLLHPISAYPVLANSLFVDTFSTTPLASTSPLTFTSLRPSNQPPSLSQSIQPIHHKPQ
ncbi:hypothetical protein ACMFMG_006372 [Clarireedia jacksonii]